MSGNSSNRDVKANSPKKNIKLNQATVAKRPAGTRPSATRSAATRPTGTKSAGTRQAATRPTSVRYSGSGQAGTRAAGTGPNGTRSAGAGNTRNRAAVARKRRRRNTLISLLPAIIIGIILALIVSSIIKSSMLKVEIVNYEYSLGTTFDINNYVKPVKDNVHIEFDDSEFSPTDIGTYKIKYKVVKGKLSKKRRLKLSVIDDTIPQINGYDEIAIVVGEECDYSEYFDVIDADPDISSKITAGTDIDTSIPGRYKVVLSVTDWYNNTAIKEIVVNVYDVEGEAVYAAKALRRYKLDMGVATDVEKIYVYAEDTNSSSRYALVNNLLYYIDDDGKCKQYSYDEGDSKSLEKYQQLVDTVKDGGTFISIDEVYGFR